MAFIRLQLLLYLFVLSAGVVVAQVPSTLKFTLFHQLVHSESAQDILPRGVIRYDPVRNSADYTQQSQVIDLSSGKGLYRIGVYDEKKKLLAPAAFTKLGHVKEPVTEEITLHLSSENVVYHISYVLKPASEQSTIIKVIPDRSILEGPNPMLKTTPVVVTPDGQPPEEEVEKTFLQKYWMYILPIVILALTSGGGGGGGGGE